MLVKYQDDIRRWFYTFQTSNPVKWICANKILTRQNSQGKSMNEKEYFFDTL